MSEIICGYCQKSIFGSDDSSKVKARLSAPQRYHYGCGQIVKKDLSRLRSQRIAKESKC